MTSNMDHDTQDENNEVKALNQVATWLAIYLTLISVAAFFTGRALIESSAGNWLTFAIALLGAAGSGIAALTSCLNRRALGWELESGLKVPPEDPRQKTPEERFNRGMSMWFWFRPFLGLIIAPIFVWGIELLVKNPAALVNSPQRLGFTAFMGGLLAKSVIDVVKGVFRGIFKQ